MTPTNQTGNNDTINGQIEFKTNAIKKAPNNITTTIIGRQPFGNE